MVFKEAKDKLQAQTSEWVAEEKKLQVSLTAAQSKLKMLQATDKTVDTATTKVAGVADRTQSARDFTDSQVAQAQANVDDLKAQLATVEAKLNASGTAKKAADSVSEATDSAVDAVNDAKASVSDSIDSKKKK
jgi:chromosome segregation ATPase